MAESNNVIGSSFMHNFSCKICLEVLHDPVQCQHNEHYFCRTCITKHLENSETCPLCTDQLTLETLRPAPRIVVSVVSQLRKPRCSHVSRGCTENVQVEELLFHEETCGYAPVVCSNEGCKESVNRRDKESHETEECKFRKITCDSCNEELAHVDFEKHRCTLRKEINEVKSRLDDMTESLKQVVLTQGEVLEKLEAHDQSIKDLQGPLRLASSATLQRDPTAIVNGQIFIFGGDYGDETGKSLEVFNWSTKTWTLVKNCLFFPRNHSFSFVREKKIMICGGGSTQWIEYLKPSESGYTSTAYPVSLPSDGKFNGLLYKDRILTFRKGVVETSLESPGESRTLLQEENGRSGAGVHCFGDNIYIVGGRENSVEKYDVVKNEIKILPSLPYKVSNMASVAYKDNIIILGGQETNGVFFRTLNDVSMYNIHSLECKRLPSMLTPRSGCAAVIMGGVVVVMGGAKDSSNALKSVEYHVIGTSEWKELPDMKIGRQWATACVYE